MTTVLNVNGVRYELDADNNVRLLDVLRDTLKLKGTRSGCGSGHCGACFVLIDGFAVASCDTPLWAAAGKSVTTVEGLGTQDAPHPLQEGFIEKQAAQCGYCTSGMLISAAGLLNRCPHPSADQVRNALERNLCRCGNQNRVVRAVLRSAVKADAKRGKMNMAYAIATQSPDREKKTPLPGADLPDKVFGGARFIHDMEFPAMLHGSMVRPPSFASRLVSLREAPQLPDGVQIVRDGSLLAVLANTQREADKAAAALASCAEWQQMDSAPELPDERDIASWLKSQPVDTKVVHSKPAAGESANSVVASTIKASYAKPFIAHASIGPSCALAHFDGAGLKVWTHSQGTYSLRKDLALAFAMEESDIVVQHVEGAGCHGHNGADDVAFDAAWLARTTPGRVVRVRWSRADELTAAPFGPAMAVDIEADLDAQGKLIAWRHSVWSNGHSNRPGRAATPALLGSWYLEKPFEPPVPINAPLIAGGGSERNAVPSYDFPSWHVVNHRVLSTPIRTSEMRALGALANVYATESFMDELAHELGQDVIAFRLAYTTDPRARAVIEAAVERSGWRKFPAREGAGWGLGFARYKNTGAYCAVVADIVAEAEIRVSRLTIAVDVGTVIDPDGVIDQIEGSAIQATSWALKEAVRFDRERITSDSWESYPILRFSEVPEVETIIIPSDQPFVGAGEGSLGPTAAAIGNAVFDVLGVRVRELPITAERIMALIP